MARRRSFAGVGPTRFSGEFVLRLLLGVLVLLAVIFVALAGVGAGLTYYVTRANNSQETVNPQSYLLNSYISLNFTDRNGGEHEGAGFYSDCAERRSSFSVTATTPIARTCCGSEA